MAFNNSYKNANDRLEPGMTFHKKSLVEIFAFELDFLQLNEHSSISLQNNLRRMYS